MTGSRSPGEVMYVGMVRGDGGDEVVSWVRSYQTRCLQQREPGIAN